MEGVDWKAIAQAFNLIVDGSAKRIDLEGGVSVYRAGTIVRVDIKIDP